MELLLATSQGRTTTIVIAVVAIGVSQMVRRSGLGANFLTRRLITFGIMTTLLVIFFAVTR
jgi:hypothetical protein